MKDCIFCKILKGELPSYKVYEDDDAVAFLSIEPFSYGHTLIVPKKHYTDYTDIPLEELNKINEAGKKVYEILNKSLKPESIQLVQNNGKLQDIKHYHLHMAPYFKEDKDNKKDLETVLKDILN